MRAPGRGSVVLDYRRSDGPVRLEVFWHRPAGWRPDGPVLIVLHGFRRNGERYRDDWATHAEAHGVLVAAPSFSKDWFPTPREYEVGNMRDASRTRWLPPADWNYALIEHVFDAVRELAGAERERYFLYGHSAGGQFVHRMVTFAPDARIEAAVAANAGAYTVPHPSPRFPYGLEGAPIDRATVQAALALPLIVLLGEEDTATEGGQLLRSPEAMAQGPHRLARGRYYFEEARRVAAELGVPFRWRLETVAGIGHSNPGMARAAAALLFGRPEDYTSSR